jgi:hypothetical protein
MQDVPIHEDPSLEGESILKPKAKRNLTDEQRLALSKRMKSINEKRLASKKQPEEIPQAPPAVETPKVTKKKRVVKVVEISEPETDSEESEEEILIVPKKKVVKAGHLPDRIKEATQKTEKPKKKPQPVYESEEEEDEPVKKSISKSKPRKKQLPSKETETTKEPEPPKILYRFL